MNSLNPCAEPMMELLLPGLCTPELGGGSWLSQGQGGVCFWAWGKAQEAVCARMQGEEGRRHGD